MGEHDRIDHPRAWRAQHLLLRVYLGLDFTHHFAEKFGLLGPQAYAKVLQYFGTVVPHPAAMVVVAGLCEYAAFVGFTFGLFTRVAAVGAALYIVIAATIGHHFSLGFTWNNPGGGWEFPALWAMLCFSFAFTGGGSWSLDRLLMPRLSAWWARREGPFAPATSTPAI